jgi:hypothetical protein
MRNIKTIDIEALEWFDKVNGNSYFSANVTINFGGKKEKRISLPFQYGYGDFYEHEAFKVLESTGIIEDADDQMHWQYCNLHKIIWRSSINDALKREVVRHTED